METISIALATTGFNNFLLRSSNSMTFPVFHDLGVTTFEKKLSGGAYC